jgi:hypothetical protein
MSERQPLIHGHKSSVRTNDMGDGEGKGGGSGIDEIKAKSVWLSVTVRSTQMHT